VAQAPALGETGREITIMFVLPESDKVNNRNELDLFLEDELDLGFEVIRAENDSEALAAICNGYEDRPTAAWVSAFTYIAAEAQCGAIPALAVTVGRAPRLEVGRSADIVARNNINTIGQLAGQAFCRIDSQDFTSWIFPSLVMAGQGIDPLSDLGAIKDYPNNLALVRAIYERDCVAAALPADELDELLDELADELDPDEDVADTMKILAPAGDINLPASAANWDGYDTNVIPYEVLVFPPDAMLPAALRETITTVILDFFEDRSAGTSRLDNLLTATGVVAVEPAHFDAFRSLLTRARWDMTFAD
jgi:ABC-type phosphate/phosphonate transport system substrate-binding protein